jgi:hypothetical protein
MTEASSLAVVAMLAFSFFGWAMTGLPRIVSQKPYARDGSAGYRHLTGRSYWLLAAALNTGALVASHFAFDDCTPFCILLVSIEALAVMCGVYELCCSWNRIVPTE